MSRFRFGLKLDFCSKCGLKIKAFDKKYKQGYPEQCLRCIIGGTKN